ncbi:MAG: hypothetical protein KF797_02835 [Flavobacteriales bacterium]|nr:hypothetical protein [Flavobacteriales bacterium]
MIDLRSDTITRPTPGTREAMAAVGVGDDAFTPYPMEQRPTPERIGPTRSLIEPATCP